MVVVVVVVVVVGRRGYPRPGRGDAERVRGRAAHRVRALQLQDSLEWRAQQGRDQAKRLLERCKGGDGARAAQWGEVWEDFLRHAQAVYGGELGGAGNTPETPAGRLEDAMCWTSTPELSSYPGEPRW